MAAIFLLTRKATPPPQSSGAPAGTNFIPASQANSIGASTVVGSQVAVSNGSEYTDTASIQKILTQPAAFSLSINNTALTITIAGAPSGTLVQVYNVQTGQLIFNINGNQTTTYTPALAHGQYVAIDFATRKPSNVVTI